MGNNSSPPSIGRIMRLLYVSMLVTLVACATPNNPERAIELDRDWQVVAVNGRLTGGGEHFILSLNPPRGWAQFGCNAGGGAVRIEPGRLVAGDWIITTAGCRSNEHERFEDEGFSILARPAVIERNGKAVRLRNERGSIVLRPMAAIALAGTSWRVINVNSQPAPADGAIRFRDRTADAFFGCNWGTIAYSQEGNILRPSSVTRTDAGCNLEGTPSVPLMTYEKWGFSILSQDVQIQRAGPEAIELRNGQGSIRLAPEAEH